MPALRRNHRLATEIERTLGGVSGVREVRASPTTGTLLVLFQPAQPRPSWEVPLAQVLGPKRALRVTSAHARLAHKQARGVARAVVRAGLRLRDSLAEAVAELRGPAEDEVMAGREQVRLRESQPCWHALETEQVCALLHARKEGLRARDASERLERDGPNALAPTPQRSELRILVDQLASTPVAMLGVSAVLSAATGGLSEALAILSVLGINVGIGFTTETGAERTIHALTATPQPSVPVLRDGKVRPVSVGNVVRGDVLLLSAGVFVAADARVLDAQNLTVDESALTGESMPVAKCAQALSRTNTALGDRVNMVYRGTLITGGSGRALVVATGTATELGHIQALAGGVVERSTPMQQQLDRLGRQLALGAGLACAATLGVGLLRGQGLLPMFRTAVSLGVAAVPEGLPTVAITTLALGLSRMRKERVLVRQLAAVETLGAVQVVCLDKTGTLTRNQMHVVAAQVGLRTYHVDEGKLTPTAAPRDTSEDAHAAELSWLLRIAVLCSEVELTRENGSLSLLGSATERALVQLALDTGVDVEDVRGRYPLLGTQRRAQARNYMTTLHAYGEGKLLAVKGRPSEVLALCSTCMRGHQRLPLSPRERAQIENDNEKMAGRALRVLGFAMREHYEAPSVPEELAPDLVWMGLIAMEDPPRPRVDEIIARFHTAGMRTVMITGDQSATAQAIGRQIGLSKEGDHLEIVDSTRLDRVDADLLGALSERADVFARVSPAHKLQIVRALQNAGHVVAMTGDGINDGPALKAADIGVAMGGTGSVAAREVADVVLEDDNLESLILAIEQGRTIYQDIRKAVHFILATNLSEILYTLACVASGLGEPLSPLQLLWINLLTDVFPELALAVQPSEADVLRRPPRDPAAPMFSADDLQRIAGEGTVITASALAAYLWGRRQDAARAGSVGFTALTLGQLLHAVSARSETHTVFDREPLKRNRYLPMALGGTAALQLAASIVPGVRTMLGTVPLRATEWSVALGAAVIPFLINEGVKLAVRTERRAPSLPDAIPPLTLAE